MYKRQILLLLPDERYQLITAFDKFLHFLCLTLMLNRVDSDVYKRQRQTEQQKLWEYESAKQAIIYITTTISRFSKSDKGYVKRVVCLLYTSRCV